METQKTFLNELMEELAKLHADPDFARLSPDIARGKSIDAFLRVACRHKLTPAERKNIVATIASLDGEITPTERQIIQALDDAQA